MDRSAAITSHTCGSGGKQVVRWWRRKKRRQCDARRNSKHCCRRRYRCCCRRYCCYYHRCATTPRRALRPALCAAMTPRRAPSTPPARTTRKDTAARTSDSSGSNHTHTHRGAHLRLLRLEPHVRVRAAVAHRHRARARLADAALGAECLCQRRQHLVREARADLGDGLPHALIRVVARQQVRAEHARALAAALPRRDGHQIQRVRQLR
jgi:hypothetical protein